MYATDSDAERETKLDAMRTLIDAHAKARSERVQIEHYRKIMLAKLMKKAELAGFKAVNQQEREAHADPEYQQLIDALTEATERDIKTGWDLEWARWRFEKWRTDQANQRAEFKAYGN